MTTRDLTGEPRFEVQAVDAGDGRIRVAARGEVDIASADELAAAVRERLPSAPVLLDLREVTFLDSSGVRVLDMLMRACGEHGWRMSLCRELQPTVEQVLEVTGMLGVLPLEDCA